ncbi:MAG: hypothetical protein OEM26_11085 [Saprospiraceae bacterium]|nr:hypothetical protein [Saprospiraceae bacterium]
MKSLVTFLLASCTLTLPAQVFQSGKIRSWNWKPNTVVTLANSEAGEIEMAPYKHRDKETKSRVSQFKWNDSDYQINERKGYYTITDHNGDVVLRSNKGGKSLYTQNGEFHRSRKYGYRKSTVYTNSEGDVVATGQYRKREILMELDYSIKDSELVSLVLLRQLMDAVKESKEADYLPLLICD